MYLHRPGLASPGLPIGENGAIKPADDAVDDWDGNLFVDFYLLGGWPEDAIESKVIFVVLSADLDMGGVTLMEISLEV